MKASSPLLENIFYLLCWLLLGGFLYYTETYVTGDAFTESLYLAAFTFLGFLLWLLYLGAKRKHFKLLFHVVLVTVFVSSVYWGAAALSLFFFMVPDRSWKGVNF